MPLLLTCRYRDIFMVIAPGFLIHLYKLNGPYCGFKISHGRLPDIRYKINILAMLPAKTPKLKFRAVENEMEPVQ